MPRHGRDTFVANISTNDTVFEKPQPTVSLQELVLALSNVLRRVELGASHQIQLETISVRERMTIILTALQQTEFVTFSSLFTPAVGRLGVVVTFLAMLELLKNDIVDFVQSVPFGPIHLKVKATITTG